MYNYAKDDHSGRPMKAQNRAECSPGEPFLGMYLALVYQFQTPIHYMYFGHNLGGSCDQAIVSHGEILKYPIEGS